jgi:hypothetical protein
MIQLHRTMQLIEEEEPVNKMKKRMGRPPKSLNTYRTKSGIDADSPSPPKTTVKKRKVRNMSTEDADSSEDDNLEEPPS